MSVSSDKNCLHLTFLPYLSSEAYSRYYQKLPNKLSMHSKILQKHDFIKKVVPENLALFFLCFDTLL